MSSKLTLAGQVVDTQTASDAGEALTRMTAPLYDDRNERYHREESRPAALRTMVHLYAWLVADLLTD